MKIRKVFCLFLILAIIITSSSDGSLKKISSTVKASSNENELIEKLPFDKSEILAKYYDDFDGNGNYEMFVIQDLSDKEYEDSKSDLWYVNGNKVINLNLGWNNGWTAYYEGKVGICKVSDKQKIFVMEYGGGGSGSGSKCYYVSKDQVVDAYVNQEERLEGLVQISGTEFAIHPSAFDEYQDPGQDEPVSCHTWKRYYLHWTGKGFKEYQGKIISKKQLENYQNGNDILKEIEGLGYEVNNIFLRSNGIININCRTADEYGGYWYQNVTLKLINNSVDIQIRSDLAYETDLSGKTIIEKSSYGGIYKTGYLEEDDVYASVEPEDTKENALKAYEKILSQSNFLFHSDSSSGDITLKSSECEFAVINVNDDDVPELIINASEAYGTYHASGSYNLFTYKNGKLIYVGNPHDDFTYFQKKGVFSKSYSGMGTSTYWYYDMDSVSEIFSVAEYYGESGELEKPKISYQCNGVKLSLNQFQKIVNSFCDDTEAIRPEYVKNTAENRSKIFSVQDKEKEQEKSIAVFTTEKSMSLQTGKSMWLGFGLMDSKDIKSDDSMVKDETYDMQWKKMALVVSDPTVISLSDYKKTDYGYSIELTGKKQGSVNITVTDTESGTNTTISINVRDDQYTVYSYSINNMPSFYPDNKWEKNLKTNIYNVNGLYVNNYQCKKVWDGYEISFDAFNSNYYSGAVDIFDKNGKWIGYEEIEKYSDISSLGDTLVQAGYMLWDLGTSKMLTYEQASFSKKTAFSGENAIKVPEGGYFTISNNITQSYGTLLNNGMELLFDTAFAALNIAEKISSSGSALDAFKEAVKIEIEKSVKDAAKESLLDNLKSEMQDIIKNYAELELKNRISKKDEMCSEIVVLLKNLLGSLEIKWEHLFGITTGLGEGVLTSLFGPAGLGIKVIFTFSKTTNAILMYNQMMNSGDDSYVTVFSAADHGYLASNGVVVDTQGSMDTDVVLQAFRISDSDMMEVILNSKNPLEQYELYNICLVKNERLVQPNGKVKVQLPIPKGMKGNTCKVYRQEPDGSWTMLDAKVEGNYLVFDTEHFSFYAVIGEKDNLAISSLPKKLNYVEGETLDTDGLILDLGGKSIKEGYMCNPMVLSGTGKQEVKVIYGYSSVEFEVNVEKEKTAVPSSTPQITSSPLISTTPSVNPVVTQKPISNPTTVPSVTVEPTNSPVVMPTLRSDFDNKDEEESMVELKRVKKVGKLKYLITASQQNKRTVAVYRPVKKNAKKLAIPAKIKIKGKTYKVTRIYNRAFQGMKKLSKVTIGSKITKIGAGAFEGCRSLEFVLLSKQVTTIGNRAFKDCIKLRYLVIRSKKIKNVGTQAFEGAYSIMKIKTPKKKWKKYAILFRKNGMPQNAVFLIEPVKILYKGKKY